MLDDLRFALRLMFRDKAWSCVVVLSLALGIGATMAMFGAVNSLYFRKIPVRDPDSLVRLRYRGPNQMATSISGYGQTPSGVGSTFSFPMYRQFLASNETMTDLVASAPGNVNLAVDGQVDRASILLVSGNYFQLLGVGAHLGRTLVPSDDEPLAPPVGVISWRAWRARFGESRDVVGSTVRVNNLPVTIVGVLRPEFSGTQRPTSQMSELTLPVSLDPHISNRGTRLEQPAAWWLQIMGRLKPGVSITQVEANLATVFQETARAGLASSLAALSEVERNMSFYKNRTSVPELIVDSGSRGIYDTGNRDRLQLIVLSTIVGLLLLIVCANVANLLLARAVTRIREIAVRRALGADRRRLVRQLLTESLVLSSIGGAAGLLVGYWAQQLLPGGSAQVHVDWRVMLFAAAITLTTGLVFGVLPAVRASAADVNSALKEGGRSIVGSRNWIGNSLLVVQVAMALALVTGAGVFTQTLRNLRGVDVGFDPGNLLLFRLNAEPNGYELPRLMNLYEQLDARFQALPGVQEVAMADVAMLSGSASSTEIYVAGRQYAPGQTKQILHVVVSPAYFETLQIPLLAGRALVDSDGTATKVALINQAAARQFFEGTPVGQRFGQSPEQADIEVAGIVGDAKYESLREPAPPTMYIPFRQVRHAFSPVFHLRTAAAPELLVPSVRAAVREIDPSVPVVNVTTQAEQIDGRMAQEQTFAQATLLFGALASLLAAVGLFGLMSYSVSRRTNEIGVRMAVGARAGSVRAQILRESLSLVAVGVVGGAILAAALGRLVSSQLFGIEAADPVTMCASAALMLAVGGAAAYVPARRAARMDPLVALRSE